ncbi:all trans-polyprenyl-diphosphate synthase PDSS2-like, partial [Musca vetustissima]|uniref:all trans-polyprenyl-diphosphate synthase PDSS2-like n=1 Tax=Musca vetustissima TaxID=27455 RepID=UPI002AB615BC
YLLKNDESAVHIWGLIILLLSKAAAAGQRCIFTKCSGDILPTQRDLAEITQLIHKSQIIHCKTTRAGQDVENFKDMLVGNKIALLFGDLLLGGSILEISKLRNQEILSLIMAGIRNMADGEFFGIRDEQNCPLPWKKQSPEILKSNSSAIKTIVDNGDTVAPHNIAEVKGNTEMEWELRNIFNGGSLLGNACKSAMILAKHSGEIQKYAYLFGKHFHLAWQSSRELKAFLLPINEK